MTKAYWNYRICVANYERVQVQKWNDKHQSLGEPSGIFRYQDKLAEITPLLATARNNELQNPVRHERSEKLCLISYLMMCCSTIL